MFASTGRRIKKVCMSPWPLKTPPNTPPSRSGRCCLQGDRSKGTPHAQHIVCLSTRRIFVPKSTSRLPCIRSRLALFSRQPLACAFWPPTSRRPSSRTSSSPTRSARISTPSFSSACSGVSKPVTDRPPREPASSASSSSAQASIPATSSSTTAQDSRPRT